MPNPHTIARARADARKGKSPSTQAGEFVREEIHHIREGKHGARSTKQAIAIGLSEARRAGVRLGSPRRGSAAVKRKAAQDSARGRRGQRAPISRRRSRAIEGALKREGHQAASRTSLARQAHRASAQRSAGERSRAARRAAATKGVKGRRAAARRAVATRRRRRD